jgi:hypothetical protein
MLTTTETIRQLPAQLFWDVDADKLDAEAHADFIIRRVMERGRSEDVRTVWDVYKPHRVKEALLSAPSLSVETIHFFANQFELPLESFRAYERANNWHR